MNTKKCPYCAELINEEAIKCKHCGEMLNLKQEPHFLDKPKYEPHFLDSPENNKSSFHDQFDKPRVVIAKKKNNKTLTWVLVIGGVLLILFIIGSNNKKSTLSNNGNLTEDKWYAGGSLHKASISDWKLATEKNKLATCADFVANIKATQGKSYNGDLISMKYDATQMMNCIDQATSGNNKIYQGMVISEIAVLCGMSFMK